MDIRGRVKGFQRWRRVRQTGRTQERWSSSHCPPTPQSSQLHFLPLTHMPWNSPVLHSLLAWASGAQPTLQAVGHLITGRRCEFPAAPLCGPLLKVCFPTPTSRSPFGGSDRRSLFPTPPAGQAQGTEGAFWEQITKEEPRRVTKAQVWAFFAPDLLPRQGSELPPKWSSSTRGSKGDLLTR